MSKIFYFIMLLVFVCLAVVGSFIGGHPTVVFFNMFMAVLYFAKLINALE